MIKGDLLLSNQQLAMRYRLTSLNEVESEILRFRLQDLTVEEIVERLEIDRHEVESRTVEIFAKLNVATLLQALNLVDKAAQII